MTPLRALILSGPTREYIDPVRYLSNASSGRQGIELTNEALSRGHRVDLVQGPVSHIPPKEARVHPVVSAEEMLSRARQLHPDCDVLIGAAAVSDFRPARQQQRKWKRERTDGPLTIELVPNPDILLELGRDKGGRIHVGFALETEDLVENARRKFREKSLDWIVVNAPSAIAAEQSFYQILARTIRPKSSGVSASGSSLAKSGTGSKRFATVARLRSPSGLKPRSIQRRVPGSSYPRWERRSGDSREDGPFNYRFPRGPQGRLSASRRRLAVRVSASRKQAEGDDTTSTGRLREALRALRSLGNIPRSTAGRRQKKIHNHHS